MAASVDQKARDMAQQAIISAAKTMIVIDLHLEQCSSAQRRVERALYGLGGLIVTLVGGMFLFILSFSP